jgi:biofilm PGA synthesis protein PgaD
MNPPLIERPDRVSRARRTVLGALTAILWIIYAYLWVPLITLVAWLIGIRTAWQRLYLEQHTVDPFIVAALPIIALLCALLLIGWAEYNRTRFFNADKRKRRGDVEDEAVDDRMGASHPVAEALRTHRIVTVRLDGDARPIGTRVLVD